MRSYKGRVRSWACIPLSIQTAVGCGVEAAGQRASGSLTMIYEEAIMAEVIEGKRTETDAILAIQSYRDANCETQIRRTEELLQKGLVTDVKAKQRLMEKVGIERRVGVGVEPAVLSFTGRV